MSKLAILPIIVIQRIIHFFLSNTFDDTWKDNLPLVAINSRWREVALPIVYKTLFISEGEFGTTGFNCDNGLGYTKSSSGATNIGLIRIIGQTHHVRSLAIILDINVGGDSLVKNIDNLFDFANNDWSQITDITVNSSMSQRHLPYASRSTVMDSQVNTIKLAVEMLINAIPNVTTLIVPPEFMIHSGIPLALLLTRAYYSQLKLLVFHELRDFPKPLTNVKHLSVCYKGNGCSITRECAAKLKHLELNTTSAINWNRFVSDSSSMNIEFPQLTHLSLRMSDVTYNHYSTLRSQPIDSKQKDIQTVVSFPELDILKLKLPSAEIANAVLLGGKYKWTHIRTLDIGGHIEYFHINTVNEIAAQIFQTIPHISKLIFNKNTTQSTILFASSLVKQYTNQLDSLICNLPIEPNNIVFGPSLKHLLLDVKHGFTCNIIGNCIHTLQTLELKNLSHDFVWQTSSNVSKSELRFMRLKILSIKLKGYNGGINDDYNSFVSNQSTDKCKLICPELTRVDIDNAIFSSLDNILSFDPNACPDVKMLSIKFLEKSRLTAKLPCPQVFDTELYPFCDRLVQGMPNVVSLNIFHSGINIYTDLFAKMLHSHYQAQLTDIVCQSTRFASDMIYNNVYKLHVNTGKPKDSEDLLPQLDCLSLQDVNLIDYSGRFSWSWFADPTVPNMVKLDNATNFVLNSDISDYKKGTYGLSKRCLSNIPKITMISMPRVKNLDIQINGSCKESTPIELHFINANAISISGHIPGIPIRSNIHSNVLNKLSIDVRSASIADENNFYTMTNSWFGNHRYTAETSLWMDNLSFEIDISRVMWDNVETLGIGTRLSTTSVVQLLPKMPNLKHILIRQLDIDTMFVNINPESPNTVIAPLSISLKSLFIEYVDTSEVAEPCNSIHCLLLGLPYVKKVSKSIIGLILSNFASNFESKYPHVADIRPEYFQYDRAHFRRLK